VKINDSNKKTPGAGPATSSVGKSDGKIASGQAAREAGKTATSQGVTDSVHLSPQAQTLATQVAASSSFNASKVEAIQKAMANGTFKVDAEKVATGLIDSVRDIISRK
jgi:negative regulator of flagellin synthesis FlgM